MSERNSRLVYSTDGETVSSDKTERGRPARAGRTTEDRSALPDDGIVRVQREKKGRRGKTVTVITGLPGDEHALEASLKDLKQHCGAGGAREGRAVVIQGDHRERARARLETQGHRVKLAGG